MQRGKAARKEVAAKRAEAEPEPGAPPADSDANPAADDAAAEGAADPSASPVQFAEYGEGVVPPGAAADEAPPDDAPRGEPIESLETVAEAEEEDDVADDMPTAEEIARRPRASQPRASAGAPAPPSNLKPYEALQAGPGR
jgi:hypothetical protein